jgi:lipid-A-disaccharide synthase-like uncharacterized protein
MQEILAKYQSAIQNPFIIIGFLGQVLFFGRFLVQWIASEKKGESYIPKSFWYLSIGGSILLLAYSINIGDIVFTLGFSLNLIIYFRNIMLIKKNK